MLAVDSYSGSEDGFGYTRAVVNQCMNLKPLLSSIVEAAVVVALSGTIVACSFEANNGNVFEGEIQPSNGIGLGLLDGVTESLLLVAPDDYVVDTDTGAIRRYRDDLTLRPEGQGVIAGIGYYPIGLDLAVVAVDSLTIEPEVYLTGVGRRSLILLSRGEVYVQGAIDVSAICFDGRLECGGAGGGIGARSLGETATGCAPGGNGADVSIGGIGGIGGTGGGGGGMASAGGHGGAGLDGAAAGFAGDNTTGRCPGASLEPLLGGSGGGAGGGLVGGIGGGGGGAVQITSLTRISLIGVASNFYLGIFANGAGGGRAQDGGGGGGGSGGAILLEAPSVILDSVFVSATGGGGGAGGLASRTVDGESGREDGMVASGGTGDGAGGDGAVATEASMAGVGGGPRTGGGGGGLGIVRINCPEAGLRMMGSRISPDYTRADLRVNTSSQ